MKRKIILKMGTVLLLLWGTPGGVRAAGPQAQLADWVAQLQGSPQDQELRKKIIQLSLKMTAKPEIPDGVNQLLGQAKYVMKQAKAPGDYKDAVEAFKKASLLAPWSGDIYYNLGVVQEKADEPADALNASIWILTEPSVLREVIDGLLRNAIENTPDGGSVTVSIEEREEDVLVHVTDTGVGISEENQQYIFDGFFHPKDTEIYASNSPTIFLRAVKA